MDSRYCRVRPRETKSMSGLSWRQLASVMTSSSSESAEKKSFIEPVVKLDDLSDPGGFLPGLLISFLRRLLSFSRFLRVFSV